jgi:hypothetical protein
MQGVVAGRSYERFRSDLGPKPHGSRLETISRGWGAFQKSWVVPVGDRGGEFILPQMRIFQKSL